MMIMMLICLLQTKWMLQLTAEKLSALEGGPQPKKRKGGLERTSLSASTSHLTIEFGLFTKMRALIFAGSPR